MKDCKWAEEIINSINNMKKHKIIDEFTHKYFMKLIKQINKQKKDKL